MIRTSNLGDIRRTGGGVVPAEGRSPFHAAILGWPPDYGTTDDAVAQRLIDSPRAANGQPAPLFADFNNADKAGRVRLNTQGAERDIAAQQLVLSDGLRVVLSDDDEIAVDAVVRYCRIEGWVAEIDWRQVDGKQTGLPCSIHDEAECHESVRFRLSAMRSQGSSCGSP